MTWTNANWLAMVEEELAGEEVEAAVVGSSAWPEDHPAPTFEPLPWDKAQAYLDQDIDRGYGSSEGRAFWIWTATRILFPAVYDGAQWVVAIPRNPSEGEPEFIGSQ